MCSQRRSIGGSTCVDMYSSRSTSLSKESDGCHPKHLEWTRGRLTNLESWTASSNIVGVVSVRSLSALGLFTVWRDTEDVGNNISSLCRLSFPLHLHRDLNVREGFRVGVVFRILSETLRREESLVSFQKVLTQRQVPRLTLKMMKSSRGTFPIRILSPRSCR